MNVTTTWLLKNTGLEQVYDPQQGTGPVIRSYTPASKFNVQAFQDGDAGLLLILDSGAVWTEIAGGDWYKFDSPNGDAIDAFGWTKGTLWALSKGCVYVKHGEANWDAHPLPGGKRTISFQVVNGQLWFLDESGHVWVEQSPKANYREYICPSVSARAFQYVAGASLWVLGDDHQLYELTGANDRDPGSWQKLATPSSGVDAFYKLPGAAPMWLLGSDAKLYEQSGGDWKVMAVNIVAFQIPNIDGRSYGRDIANGRYK